MRSLKLGTKLYLGFGVVVLLLALVGTIAFISLRQVVTGGNQALQASAQSRFISQKESALLSWINEVKDLFLKNQPTLKVEIDPRKCGLGEFLYGEKAKRMAAENPGLARLLQEIKAPHLRLHQSAASIRKAWKPNHPGLAMTLAARFADHRRWAGSLVDSLLTEKEITVELDPQKCALGKWLAGEQARRLGKKWPAFGDLIAQMRAHHDRLHKGAREIKAAQWPDVRIQIYVQKTIPELNALAALFDKAQDMEHQLDSAQDKARGIFEKQTLPALAAIQAKLRAVMDLLDQDLDRSQGSMREVAAWSSNASLAAAVLGVVIGFLLSFFLTRGITRGVNQVVSGLRASVGQTAAASEQVSAFSQTLAQGASEQAASLEQTSASMEQMSSMTKQNANNARQADSLMKEAMEVVGKANRSMEELKTAMDKINAASDETAKIIKTIDEIAFQTNLLALNAAVEAARAGEAGAGFAVVADEVRSLAMRAAEAAKNTDALIEENLRDIDTGSQLVSRTDQAFSEVEANAAKVAELVAEIAAASQEQDQGIEQINQATLEMDKVTQQVAANAEESAAAGEELAAQVATMQGLVEDLVALVQGAEEPGQDTAAPAQEPKALPPVEQEG